MGGLENKENKLETQDVCQKIYLYSVLATGFADQLLWKRWRITASPKTFFPQRVLLGVLCEGVLPLSPNPDRYIRLKMSFCTPVFRPGL